MDFNYQWSMYCAELVKKQMPNVTKISTDTTNRNLFELTFSDGTVKKAEIYDDGQFERYYTDMVNEREEKWSNPEFLKRMEEKAMIMLEEGNTSQKNITKEKKICEIEENTKEDIQAHIDASRSVEFREGTGFCADGSEYFDPMILFNENVMKSMKPDEYEGLLNIVFGKKKTH